MNVGELIEDGRGLWVFIFKGRLSNGEVPVLAVFDYDDDPDWFGNAR